MNHSSQKNADDHGRPSAARPARPTVAVEQRAHGGQRARPAGVASAQHDRGRAAAGCAGRRRRARPRPAPAAAGTAAARPSPTTRRPPRRRPRQTSAADQRRARGRRRVGVRPASALLGPRRPAGSRRRRLELRRRVRPGTRPGHAGDHAPARAAGGSRPSRAAALQPPSARRPLGAGPPRRPRASRPAAPGDPVNSSNWSTAWCTSRSSPPTRTRSAAAARERRRPRVVDHLEHHRDVGAAGDQRGVLGRGGDGRHDDLAVDPAVGRASSTRHLRVPAGAPRSRPRRPPPAPGRGPAA